VVSKTLREEKKVHVSCFQQVINTGHLWTRWSENGGDRCESTIGEQGGGFEIAVQKPIQRCPADGGGSGVKKPATYGEFSNPQDLHLNGGRKNETGSVLEIKALSRLNTMTQWAGREAKGAGRPTGGRGRILT